MPRLNFHEAKLWREDGFDASLQIDIDGEMNVAAGDCGFFFFEDARVAGDFLFELAKSSDAVATEATKDGFH